MKRFLLFLLIVAFCFSAISCNQPTQNDLTTNNQDNENVEESGPLAGDDNSMFKYPEDPRKFVVKYITDMAETPWTPETTFQMYGKYQAWSYNLTYEAGQKYYGLPFLTNSRGTLEQFLNSVENGVYKGGTTSADCIGNACYDAVYVTLIQVCPSITFKSTEDMLPGNNTGLLAVGNWDSSVSSHDTPTIIKANNRQTMAEGYALLKPGDVVLKHVVAQDAGHTRIVSGGPVVYRNDNGTIDTAKSYILTVEQTNQWDKKTTRKTSWWVDHQYTFDELYNTNFVPLTPKDYTADLKAPYINAENLLSPEETGDARKLAGTLTSNHYITEIEIEITSENGAKLFSSKYFPRAKKVFLQDLKYNPKFYNAMPGTYHFTMKASLSSGTKTVADYDFILE